MIPCNQKDIAQLLMLQVGLHFAEGLLCVVCGLEKLIGAVRAHSGIGAQSQPMKTKEKVKGH